MRTVNYSRYYLPPSPGSGPRAKRYPSGWEMSPEQAAQRGLTDTDIVPGTTVARQEFDPDEVRRTMQSAGMDGARGG